MMKLFLTACCMIGLQATAFGFQSLTTLPTEDELVSAEEMMLQIEEEEGNYQNLDRHRDRHRRHVTCYARDRFGYLYSASHPHAHKAQQKALRQCHYASDGPCYRAGCRRPGYPPRRRGD